MIPPTTMAQMIVGAVSMTLQTDAVVTSKSIPEKEFIPVTFAPIQ